MNIVFSKAKNGQETCSIDNKFYHSKYNPQEECERWLNQIKCDFIPQVILVLGAGLPYSLPQLQNKFFNSKIFLIQYHQDFIHKVCYKNQLCTKDFTSINQLSEYFFNLFGEEICNRILILSWKPSETIFKDDFLFVTKSIQLYFEKSKNVISTRRYFSKKWFYNSVRFFCQCKTFSSIDTGNSDIIIAASGPSLKDGIKFLKYNRDKYFLIAVSSALSPLLHCNIIPDLLISTDGGFWAKNHMNCLRRKHINIPILCSIESGIPWDLLDNSTFIPINYGDFTNKVFFKLTKTENILSARNGTVSGNAIEIALKLTTGNVYTIGLDLEYTKGYQHTQPNILEIQDSVFDNKIHNTETRVVKRNLNTQSLSVYKSWFENLSSDKTSRINRLFLKEHDNLGTIKSIIFDDIRFNSKLKFNEKLQFPMFTNTKISDYRNTIIDYFSKLTDYFTTYNSESVLNNYGDWLKELSLGNMLNYSKYKRTEFLNAAIQETLDCFNYALKKLR